MNKNYTFEDFSNDLDNGYKISTEGFLSNNYISYDELLQITGYQINIYLVYKEFLN